MRRARQFSKTCNFFRDFIALSFCGSSNTPVFLIRNSIYYYPKQPALICTLFQWQCQQPTHFSFPAPSIAMVTSITSPSQIWPCQTWENIQPPMTNGSISLTIPPRFHHQPRYSALPSKHFQTLQLKPSLSLSTTVSTLYSHYIIQSTCLPSPYLGSSNQKAPH